MKNFLTLLFALCLPLSAIAATGSGNVSNVLAPGGSSLNPQPLFISDSNIGTSTGWFSINAGDNGLSADQFTPFLKSGVNYQVTTGKTAVCIGAMGYTGGASTDKYQLVSATASFAHGAASITGGVYMGGAAARYPMVYPDGTSLNKWGSMGYTYTFGATTFPGIQVSTSSAQAVVLHCKEI